MINRILQALPTHYDFHKIIVSDLACISQIKALIIKRISIAGAVTIAIWRLRSLSSAHLSDFAIVRFSPEAAAV